ncbi:MAG: hypothetical protein IH585_09160 [Anaerolineaceae bacterium]|nr:hypothetical protein [Anaerolineaceae bacterium]
MGELRSYIGDADAVLTNYIGQTVDKYPPQVVLLESEQFPEEIKNVIPSPLNEMTNWNLPQTNEQQLIFLVYVLIVDYEGDLKLDCSLQD